MKKQMPELVSKILKSTLKALNLTEDLKKYAIWDVWEDIVGEKIAKNTFLKHFRVNTLVVAVKNHSWLAELHFLKPLLFQKIKKILPDCPIEDIQFEIMHKN